MTATAAPPAASVLVPSWNGRELLPDCLSSIRVALARWGREAQVIVVDDGSTDGSASLVGTALPGAHVLRLERRGGFVRAANRGMRECGGDWVLLLNNDVRIEPDFFVAAEPHLSGSPRLFALAPCIVAREGDREIDESLYVPWIRRAKIEVVPPGERAPAKGGSVRVHYACGAACFLSRSLFLDLGGFDEIFSPFYWEDVDLSARALSRGLEIAHEPRCRALHLRSATLRRIGDVERLGTYYRNQEVLFWKHAAGVRMLALHLALLPARILRALATADAPVAFGLARALTLLPRVAWRRLLARPPGGRAPLEAWIP